MQLDDYGHINVLIAWYAGNNFRGGKLTDTLMLASFDPKLWTVTFLSIPRDLYVRFGRGATSRINSLYPSMYIETKQNHDLAVKALMEKVTEITGIPVQYYAMVDFDGFVSFVDTVWGVDVEVKEPLYDDQYPGANDSYTVFQVSAGMQHFDGATALKFARSRKSTSDFSRSFRQQQIIAAVVDKLKQSVGITNIAEMKKIYAKGMEIFQTNISLENMLWMAQYGKEKPKFFSYVYEADCSTKSTNLAIPGCVLVFGDRASFGWQSVMIPIGASRGNLSYYKKTQDVAHRLVYRQDVLSEEAPIIIQNGIDKESAKKQWYKTSGVADELGVDLVLRGFQVDEIKNSETPQEKTVLYTSDQVLYKETIEALAAFADYTEIVETEQYGVWITLILWNDRLKRM